MTRHAPKAVAMANAVRNSVQHVLVAQVQGRVPHAQVRGQVAGHAAIRRAITAQHHGVMPPLRVRAHLTALAVQSEQVQA